MPGAEHKRITRFEINDHWLDIYWAGNSKPSVTINRLEYPVLRIAVRASKYALPLTSIREFHIRPLAKDKIELVVGHGDIVESLGVTDKDNQIAYRWIELANAELIKARQG